MIARLTGRIDQLEADRCIVDVNGVGDRVHGLVLSHHPLVQVFRKVKQFLLFALD